MTAYDLADEIAMEWQRVPMMPTQEMFDRAWRNILIRARAEHGNELVARALHLARGRFGGRIPSRDE